MQTDVMEAQVQSNTENIKELRKIIIGNGEIGIAEQMRDVAKTSDNIYNMLEIHVNEDKAEADRLLKKRDKIQAGIVIGLVIQFIVLILGRL